MKRSLIIWILFLLFCYSFKAQDMPNYRRTTMLPEQYLYLAGTDLRMKNRGEMYQYTLAENSYAYVYLFPSLDSVILIRTQCAPMCCSYVQVCDREWNVLRTIPAPDSIVMPDAYVLDGQLYWRENFVEDESPK